MRCCTCSTTSPCRRKWRTARGSRSSGWSRSAVARRRRSRSSRPPRPIRASEPDAPDRDAHDDHASETMRPGITALAERAFTPQGELAFPLDAEGTAALVREALAEDRAIDDVTSIATVPDDRIARAVMVARRPGVVCGSALAVETFRQCDPSLTIRVDLADGKSMDRGAAVLHVAGRA